MKNTSFLQKHWRRLAAVALILAGLGLVAVYGSRSLHSFREIRYIRESGLDDGTADVSAIRPWMTPRFVAVAYGVPEEYLYDRLGIELDRRDVNAPLGRINHRLGLGRDPLREDPAILEEVQNIILEYQANPVTVELGRLEPWMSIRYIANSTGVPEADLLAALELPADDEIANTPLRFLVERRELNLPDPRQVQRILQDALREAGVGP